MQLIPTLLAAAALTLSLSATAQEAAIRKTLAERIPQMEKIDEVQPTSMPVESPVLRGMSLTWHCPYRTP